MLYAYLFFHCNLAFSSIEEEQRGFVIDRCYSPMLDLAEHGGIPIGVEATGWTLEEIARLRPTWMERLKTLLARGKCEFIGSGYAQIIGPLVPAAVNAANQRLGMTVYENLLGLRPSLALINEQAWSSGILEHYADNGYAGVVMEWDNPRLAHPEWPPEYRYAPQKVRDMRGRSLNLLWNQSVVFQHLQRVAHDELDVEDYVRAVLHHDSGAPRALCLYGNDAEIFAFRPGRFETEAPLANDEWETIARVLTRLRECGRCSFCLPGETFRLALPNSGDALTLESPSMPAPVKKQPKYTILRWAVTGRDDFNINSRCRALAETLRRADAGDGDWRELCFLWTSDFRTHITERRWEAYQRRLSAFEKKYDLPGPLFLSALPPAGDDGQKKRDARRSKADKRLILESPSGTVTLNPRKGLAVDSALFPSISEAPLFGTLPHGFFDSISLAADFFTGHTVMELPGQRKRTDLAPVPAKVTETAEAVQAECRIPDFYCPMRKRIILWRDRPELEIVYSFAWDDLPPAVVRLFHLTLFPGAFGADSLYYATHNGGAAPERFPLRDAFDHGRSVSFLVSSAQALAMTEGYMEIGDAERALRITLVPSSLALAAMISHRETGERAFTRVTFSCREFDETAKTIRQAGCMGIGIRVLAVKHAT